MKHGLPLDNACKNFEEDLVLHYYGENNRVERRRVEQHLSICHGCKSFVDDLDRVLTAVHAGTAVVLKRADEAIDEMTRLDAEMYGLVDIPGRRRDVTELAQLMRQATGSAIQMTDALDDLERSVAATLERARAIESEERTQVEELLWSLKQTRQDLLRRLRGKRDQGTRR